MEIALFALYCGMQYRGNVTRSIPSILIYVVSGCSEIRLCKALFVKQVGAQHSCAFHGLFHLPRFDFSLIAA